jgi:hypothetical protein
MLKWKTFLQILLNYLAIQLSDYEGITLEVMVTYSALGCCKPNNAHVYEVHISD